MKEPVIESGWVKAKVRNHPEVKECCPKCSPEYVDGKPRCDCECHEEKISLCKSCMSMTKTVCGKCGKVK
jgi:hypothetical protein